MEHNISVANFAFQIAMENWPKTRSLLHFTNFWIKIGGEEDSLLGLYRSPING